jgi:hypothetical protein
MEYIIEAPLDKAPEQLLQRFPRWRSRIESEYCLNEPFRALCDDWCICAEARERWRSSEAPVAARRRNEYGEWLAELEQEIEEWLQHDAQAAPIRTGGES